MEDRAPGYVTLGAACVVAGALAWLWAMLAMQPPTSSWHVAGFPGAIDRLATHAWLTGLAALTLAPREGGRRALALAAVGSLLSLGALAWSARTGWLGVQLHDARAGSAAVLAGRVLGGACLAVALGLRLRDARAR